MHTFSFLKIFYISLIISFLVSCKTIQEVSQPLAHSERQELPKYMLGGGSSGMCAFGSASFLTVYDLKNFQEGSRLGFIQSFQDSLTIKPIEIIEWDSWGGPSSDLESICEVPGRNGEFLMSESGNWQGKGGRVFHIYVDTLNYEAKIKGVFQLPLYKENNFDLTGDQYEGMVCLRADENNYTLLLGERGGSKAIPNGRIRWATINFDDYSLKFSTDGFIGKTIHAPGNWSNPFEKRDISDLYLDLNNILWAVGSEDSGDAGPFYSVIYKVGKLSENSESMVDFFEQLVPWRELYGFKVEALAKPSSNIPQGLLSIGTEDEIYGGVWRVLK